MSNEDFNLQESWNRVCGSYFKTTDGLDLTKRPIYTPDEVLEKIRGEKGKDKEKDAKFNAAKDVIGKTLNCVYLLGGIAAQGASMVFGPSNLCFNAVAYLVETGMKYKHIFTGLAALFSRISNVLERTKIYLRMRPESVDIALRKIINDELLCFVSICALSTKVLKGSKIRIALSVFFFDSDEGVSEEMNKLAALVDKEAQMRETLAFESQKASEKLITETKEGTKKVNATVDRVLELENKRDSDNKMEQLLKKIDENLDTPSKGYEAVQGTYKVIQSKKVEGSGKWLKEDPLYTAWSTHDQPSSSILCISGDEGYGKSFLFSTVIQDLQDRYAQTADSMICTSVAYYFFQLENIAKGSQPAEKDALAFVKALTVLAWQIVNSDIVYRKDLASVKVSSAIPLNSLWNMLFAKAYKTDSTMFLLLDGIDRLEKEQITELWKLLEELQRIACDWRKFRLRILLSGRNATINLIENQLNKQIYVIHIASKNRDDVGKFIASQVRRMNTLTGTSPQVETLKTEILKKLTDEANGDFINVSFLLNEIGEKQRPHEIRDVLEKSGEKRSDTIARKIEGLNETLRDNDISDLNDILTWVMCSYCPLTLEELEAVLFIKNKEPSLRSLSDEIQDKYSALFHILGDWNPETENMSPKATVSLVSDSIEEYFKTKAKIEAAEDDKKWDLTGDVHESEVRIVKHFLQSVCDENLFKKFDFESFFQQKLNKRTAKIGVELENGTAHFKIATTCISAICLETSTDTSPLDDYAMNLFTYHLAKADPSLTQPQSKINLGPQLVRLFTDEKIFKKWLFDGFNICRASNWVREDDSVDVILNWLQDSAVTKNLSEDDKKWVKSLSSKSEPHADLLQHVAKSMAQTWLQDSQISRPYRLSALFCWFHRYVTKIENRKNFHTKRSTNLIGPSSSSDISVAQIITAANWALEMIGLESMGYEENLNVARTLEEYEKYPEAIEYYKLASSLQSENWLSQLGLAGVYEKQKEWTLAIQTLQGVRTKIENFGTEVDNAKDILDDILPQQLASCYKGAGDIDMALEIYEAVLEESPDDYLTALKILWILGKKDDLTRSLEFLENLKLSKDRCTGLDRRTQIFHSLCFEPKYHEIIYVVGSSSSTFDVIKNAYQTALDAAEVMPKDARDSFGELRQQQILAFLLYHFAQFLYHHHSSSEIDKQYAILMWERILTINRSDRGSAILYAIRSTTYKLSSIYFQKARLASDRSEAAAVYIKKLTQISLMNRDAIMDLWTFPHQLIARWYALIGQESKSKITLRFFIKKSLDLLSDDDPTNDWQGYTGLASHFMSIGQDDDALAAWSLITPIDESKDSEVDDNTPIPNPQGIESSSESGRESTDGIQVAGETNTAMIKENASSSTENAKTKSESTHDKTKRLKGPLLMYRCKGPSCKSYWTYPDDMYVCRVCWNVQFDKQCYEALLAGTMETNFCDKSHDMLHVPKYDALELDRIGKGNVKVGSTIMTVDDWILGIKKRWDIAV